MVIPKEKETIITADKHVTKYKAHVPADSTDDQIKKVAEAFSAKIGTGTASTGDSAALNINTATGNVTNGVG